MAMPKEPILFLKANSALSGPNDDIMLPRGSEKADWEVELTIVIGREAKYVTEADAMNYVAGLTIMNDVSERTFQLEHEGQWTKGKSCDTFAPLGPWVVTLDEVGDYNNLKMWCAVNGERMQDGSSATMIFRLPFIVSYLSQFFTLHPGDVIATGTPPGVGMGKQPPIFLKAGDQLTTGIEHLGEQSNKVVPGR